MNKTKVINPPHIFWKPTIHFFIKFVCSIIVDLILLNLINISYDYFVLYFIPTLFILNYTIWSEPIVIITDTEIYVQRWLFYLLRLPIKKAYPKQVLSQSNIKVVSDTDCGYMEANRKYKFPWYQNDIKVGLQLYSPKVWEYNQSYNQSKAAKSFHLILLKGDSGLVIFEFLSLKDLERGIKDI